MYEHLRTWTANPTDSVSFRLDLWDTGRTRDGKSELRYALFVLEGSAADGQSAIFEGEDFHCSPLHAIDSDETAAALLSFFAHDGEMMSYGHEMEESSYSIKQRTLLESNHELLSLWSYELEGAE